MLIGNKYDNLHKLYLLAKYYTSPIIHKFCILMLSKKETVIRSVATYLYYANLRRSNLLGHTNV